MSETTAKRAVSRARREALSVIWLPPRDEAANLNPVTYPLSLSLMVAGSLAIAGSCRIANHLIGDAIAMVSGIAFGLGAGSLFWVVHL